MPLDFTQLAAQIEAYVPRFRDESARQTEEAVRLQDVLLDLGDQWQMVDDRRAGFLEDPTALYPPPPPLGDYRVVATDGSQVNVDRHQAASCYVINVGTVVIQYGSRPDAALGSVAQLLPDHPDDNTDDTNGDADQPSPSRQTSLELERAAAELRVLREVVESTPPDLFTVAMVDNSLVL